MAENPLLGNRISLISKKNIRYEGTLYSINESDATVALQNVKSFGTEGREKTEEGCTFVPPQDAVHPYLLFRGCDIKDLHVHEEPAAKKEETKKTEPKKTATETTSKPKQEAKKQDAKKQDAQPKKETKKSSTRRPRQQSNKPKAQVGTGASLLTRKERGTVEGGLETPDNDFDFQSNLENFQKEDEDDTDEEDIHDSSAYAKNDFFDTISCDAIDKRDGVDNRLRGSAERNLNTETFGASSLNSQRRRRYGGRGGRGRGRSGRGRSNRAPRQQNNRWQKDSGSRQRNSTQSASGVPS